MHSNPPQKVPMTHPRSMAQNANHEALHPSPAVPLKTECPEWGDHGCQSSPKEGGHGVKTLHLGEVFPRHPLVRHSVLELPTEAVE